jgi:ABC-type lipoprotein release transport system permease subunit
MGILNDMKEPVFKYSMQALGIGICLGILVLILGFGLIHGLEYLCDKNIVACGTPTNRR